MYSTCVPMRRLHKFYPFFYFYFFSISPLLLLVYHFFAPRPYVCSFLPFFVFGSLTVESIQLKQTFHFWIFHLAEFLTRTYPPNTHTLRKGSTHTRIAWWYYHSRGRVHIHTSAELYCRYILWTNAFTKIITDDVLYIFVYIQVYDMCGWKREKGSNVFSFHFRTDFIHHHVCIVCWLEGNGYWMGYRIER